MTVSLDRKDDPQRLIDFTCALQQIQVGRDQCHTTVARRHRLSLSDLDCLCHLYSAGPLASGQLAQLLGVTPSAITGIVDTLVRRGLVERSAHPHDRRITLVSMTAAGAAVIDDLMQLTWNRIRDTDMDLAEVATMLQRIAEILRACTQDVQ